MPLWRVFHPSNTTFQTPSSKADLSAAITSLYTSFGLPAFYVIVLFIPIDPQDMFVGGVNQSDGERRPFVRIVFENIARNVPEGQARLNFLDKVDKALYPHILAKNYDLEYHGVETERSLWKINGMVAPPTGSEGEKMWIREGRAVEWEGKDGEWPHGER
ncbi:hypothetical protein K490DRAFT_45467 [Saccharata proteae CBS 121410]|uniref:Tautomerase cis-CaaD-like domain-containing protein n=1 Tax=Saccharata proteae CBS 121410 TaxID=1314787 RepID=A0A9P4LVI3_9PEZI|nr:hypothetical protein K490DRAFT_45467 [Saccharata proteae CBS 121410]